MATEAGARLATVWQNPLVNKAITLTDFAVSDFTKFESQLVKVTSQFNEAVANREKSQEHLKADRDWLKAKLDATKAKMKENSHGLLELREAIDKC